MLPRRIIGSSDVRDDPAELEDAYGGLRSSEFEMCDRGEDGGDLEGGDLNPRDTSDDLVASTPFNR